MSFSLEWTIEGEKQLAREMLGFTVRLKDFTIPFTDATKQLTKIFSTDVFNTQGGVIGEQWKRLSPYTVAQKARLGFPQDTLVRTGTMKKSFKSIVETHQAVIYNDVDYFKYHQSNAPRKKIPRRVMMKLGDQQKQIVVKSFQKYFFKMNQY